MSGILLNLAFITLAGSIILIVRKIWGETLHPLVLKGLWILFFLCALCPVPYMERLGRTLRHPGREEAPVKYEWSAENAWHFENVTLPGDNMDGYRLRRKVREAALTVWAVGCIVSLLYRIIGAAIFHHKSRADRKYRLAPEKLREMGISLSVPVEITESAGPMVLGIRPAVYVPESFLQGDESLFRSILLHEQAHITRKHHLILLLMNLTGSLYWFLPYVEGIFFRALREDMEYRCDYEVVAKQGVDAKEYARHCIAMAQGRGRLCSGLSFGKGGLKKRVRHILQNRKSKWAALAACATAGITVLVCFIGAAVYYKRDVQGFTRWEVEDAKEAVVNYVDAYNSKRKEAMDACLTENSPRKEAIDYVTDNLEGGDAVYDITYLPKDWLYYYVVKYWDTQGDDKQNCIYLLAIYESQGKQYYWAFFLVRKDENSPWKVHRMGFV
ncbi:MAG: hypothetical protein NC094_10435 [Bacteroidales bacterium]|nr:hypothetical protein [Lachnoclostridium sp.]MCM1384937.1 hypothetical protein [Lachnoclostridium sp.]MCM1465825.1 hypothetical protein [Bacteroidales bacterium]